MDMTMTYEHITPEIAEKYLGKNLVNRKLSDVTVYAYMQDMLNGSWDDTTGDTISFDEHGNLVNGQHRLTAVAKSGHAIDVWVCRGASSTGIYDNNRKRSCSDQITILRPDFAPIYRTSKYISIAKAIIAYNTSPKRNRRPVTAKEVVAFTEAHMDDLNGYFLNMPQDKTPKISLAVVHLSLFMAFMGGVGIGDISKFYDVLRTGMSTCEEEFPIIAYRNYLKDTTGVTTTIAEISRCQYALKKYLTGSCAKQSRCPAELIWPFPWGNKEKAI